jgi:hypothetical protein
MDVGLLHACSHETLAAELRHAGRVSTSGHAFYLAIGIAASSDRIGCIHSKRNRTEQLCDDGNGGGTPELQTCIACLDFVPCGIIRPQIEWASHPYIRQDTTLALVAALRPIQVAQGRRVAAKCVPPLLSNLPSLSFRCAAIANQLPDAGTFSMEHAEVVSSGCCRNFGRPDVCRSPRSPPLVLVVQRESSLPHERKNKKKEMLYLFFCP